MTCSSLAWLAGDAEPQCKNIPIWQCVNNRCVHVRASLACVIACVVMCFVACRRGVQHTEIHVALQLCFVACRRGVQRSELYISLQLWRIASFDREPALQETACTHGDLASLHGGNSLARLHGPTERTVSWLQGLRPDTLFGCLYEYLFDPLPEVKEMFQSELAVMQDSTLKIAIQVQDLFHNLYACLADWSYAQCAADSDWR